jgi:hypothetical protein
MSIQSIANKINKLAENYDIGNLQKIRKEIKSFQRLPAKQIFPSRILKKRGYAFHVGGRKEIQYNIGFEDEEKFRYGLAFSLHRDRNLPDVSIMKPRIRKFNYLLRNNPALFTGYKMWALVDDEISDIEKIHEIEPSIVKPETFIFFGKLIDLKSLDYDEVLSTFDKMLPIYLYIEKKEAKPEIDKINKYIFSFKKTNVSLPHTKSYYTKQVEIEIDIRHTKIQEKLVNKLSKEYGNENVALEHPLNGNKIDVVVNDNGKRIFYEIKTASNARDCIRQALGQILDYAYWPGNKNADTLVIVGEKAIDKDTKNYLKYLNNKCRIKLEYLQIKL